MSDTGAVRDARQMPPWRLRRALGVLIVGVPAAWMTTLCRFPGRRLFGWALLLPMAMLGAGAFLLVCSDHEAWPIGSLGFVQTFFGIDWEIVQHKLYAVLLLAVGPIELLRRTGRIAQAWLRMPLPALAILGGLALFLHTHGAHPAAHKIALNHTIMGIMAITAGSSKLVSELASHSRWGLAWACLILLIGVQLLFYSE